jgi:molybdenum cofactor sulfurtransferase
MSTIATSIFLFSTENVIVRTGCFCNVGACQRYLGFDDNDLAHSHQQGHVCGDDVDLLDDGRPLGAIRISFGHYSRKEDADRIVQLLEENFLAPQPLDNAPARSKGVITAISVYPLKSCAPMRVNAWPLSADGGLLLDRQWAVFQGEKCITQKQSKTLCLIQPHIDLPSAQLTLSFPGLTSISIPIEDNLAGVSRLEVCVGNVCGEGVRGFDCGPAVSAWLETALALPGLRLLRSVGRASTTTSSLANDGQFLILNSASAKFLGQRLGERPEPSHADDLDWILRQFRGNLVVDGPPAFSEDKWNTLHVGPQVVLERHRTCKRCSMISVNQSTGQDVRGLVQVLTKIPERRFAFGTLFSLRKEVAALEVRVGDKVRINALMENITGQKYS